MKRDCLHYKSSDLYSRHLYIDIHDGDDIIIFLEDKKIRKKFDYIVNRILSQNFIYYEEYEKIQAFKNLSEMRIFPNGMNARIYCKEVRTNNGNFYIVAAKLLPKKGSMKIDKSIIEFIKPLEDYIYDI